MMNNNYLKREGLDNREEDIKYNPDDAFEDNLERPSQITPGFEDLYVLKTSTFPPVNTKQYVYVDDDESLEEEEETLPKGKCPPCPPCGRCPEPAFECKKVPNYKSNNDQYLPRPVLNDFSQFGM
jgi:hypothetical protein